MIKQLEETNLDIQDIIKSKISQNMDYFGDATEIPIVISWLLQHEQLHYGKLILYFSKCEIEIPKSLKQMWGENNF